MRWTSRHGKRSGDDGEKRLQLRSPPTVSTRASGGIFAARRTHSPTYEDVRRLQHRIPAESDVAEFLTASEYEVFTDAPIFVVSPQMMHVVAAAAASLTVDDLERGFDFTRSPESGVLLLPRGTRFKTAGGRYEGTVRLLSWGGDIVHNEYAGPRGRSVHSIGVELWVPGDARAPLAQVSTQMLTRAESIPEAGVSLARVGDADAAEHTSGDALPNADGLIGPRLLYAFLRLLEQKTASESPMPTKSKRARRVARQAGVDNPGADEVSVRVVNLAKRRSESGEAPGDDGPIEWKSRWVVRMHKRLQPYGPGRTKRKVIFVGPYVKGPGDKPIRQSKTVGALR